METKGPRMILLLSGKALCLRGELTYKRFSNYCKEGLSNRHCLIAVLAPQDYLRQWSKSL